MEIKVSELAGRALDYAVAKAVGLFVTKDFDRYMVETPDGVKNLGHVGLQFNPSGDWGQVGVIISTFKVGFSIMDDESVDADIVDHERGMAFLQNGQTHQIAACRVIVASKLGDEVQVPDELVVNNEQP